MPRQLVNREELGRLIAQTNGAISMINESNYLVRSKSGNNAYTIIATKSGWASSLPIILPHLGNMSVITLCPLSPEDMM